MCHLTDKPHLACPLVNQCMFESDPEFDHLEIPYPAAAEGSGSEAGDGFLKPSGLPGH